MSNNVEFNQELVNTYFTDWVGVSALNTEDSKKVFAILRQNKTTNNFPPALASIFDITIQPFMSNWMQHDPQKIIKG